MIEELFNTIREGAAHQSVLIEGDVEALLKECVEASARKMGVTLYPISADVWTISHSRAVSTRASHTTDGPLCIVMAGNVFTIESQHALLKVTEEALPNIFFVLITRNADALLATLRSRCLLIRGERSVGVQGKKFLGLSIPERLTAVASAIESPEHANAYTLLAELSAHLAREVTTGKHLVFASWSHLTRTRHFLSTHPIGMRNLLEHLALTLDPTDK